MDAFHFPEEQGRPDGNPDPLDPGKSHDGRLPEGVFKIPVSQGYFQQLLHHHKLYAHYHFVGLHGGVTKIRFPGADGLLKLYLASMMIPTQVTLIPLFVIMNKLGLINTYPSVILPSLFRVFGIFMLVQQMRSIPYDFMEAARIDGAGMFRIFRVVILPLCGSSIATLTITTFMESWNDYLWPLLMLTDKNKMTLTLALNNLNGQYGTEYNVLMAGSLISMLPIIIVYACAQKNFKQGVMAGGIKG